MNQPFSHPLETLLMNNQPITCPHCGARTQILASFYHTNAKSSVEKCPDEQCGFICKVEEDEEFVIL